MLRIDIMLTEKENYLLLLNHKCPEWVPNYSFGADPSGKPVASVMIEPPILSDYRFKGGGKDVWGVEFIGNIETGGALMPKPGVVILDDITKWRDVIKAPSLEGIDWEAQVNMMLGQFKFDRSQSAVAFNMHYGYFQNLMGMMGFTEGLCAMYEEPEEVYALLDYLCTFYCEIAKNIMPILKPDVFTLMDDTAAWANPFISPQMYHDLIFPFHYRQSQFARDAGIPITMHNCGKCECFISDFLALGVDLMEPAQTCNDLDGIKKTYGDRLTIAGAWDARGRLLEPDVTDDEIRQSVIDAIDRYAPGGGYAFCGGFLGAAGDPEPKRKNRMVAETVKNYGGGFYRK